MKKFVSWNVNGIRACVQKGFSEVFKTLDADIFCLQETKLQQGQIDLELDGYHQYWNYAERKGYSGTAIFTKEKPLAVFNGMDIAEHDTEGRLITLEFENYYFLTCYTPNAQDGLKRLDYRMKWEDDFREYLLSLDKTKPVIFCGDLNVAHNEIDLKNPKTNRGNPGFSDEERGKFSLLLESGFTTTIFGELFNSLFKKGGENCVLIESTFPSPEETLEAIHDAGGIAVLAHPGFYNNFELLDELIPLGLDGVEVWHPENTPEQQEYLKKQAKKHKLVMTGGSDFHGGYNAYPVCLGQYGPDDEALAALISYKAKMKRRQKKAAAAKETEAK